MRTRPGPRLGHRPRLNARGGARGVRRGPGVGGPERGSGAMPPPRAQCPRRGLGPRWRPGPHSRAPPRASELPVAGVRGSGGCRPRPARATRNARPPDARLGRNAARGAQAPTPGLRLGHCARGGARALRPAPARQDLRGRHPLGPAMTRSGAGVGRNARPPGRASGATSEAALGPEAGPGVPAPRLGHCASGIAPDPRWRCRTPPSQLEPAPPSTEAPFQLRELLAELLDPQLASAAVAERDALSSYLAGVVQGPRLGASSTWGSSVAGAAGGRRDAPGAGSVGGLAPSSAGPGLGEHRCCRSANIGATGTSDSIRSRAGRDGSGPQQIRLLCVKWRRWHRCPLKSALRDAAPGQILDDPRPLGPILRDAVGPPRRTRGPSCRASRPRPRAPRRGRSRARGRACDAARGPACDTAVRAPRAARPPSVAVRVSTSFSFFAERRSLLGQCARMAHREARRIVCKHARPNAQ